MSAKPAEHRGVDRLASIRSQAFAMLRIALRLSNSLRQLSPADTFEPFLPASVNIDAYSS